jgi:hypothetical protein
MHVKIRGFETKEVELRVEDYQILEQAILIVRTKNGIGADDFLKDGKVMYDDPDHRHGSIQEYERRVATPSDLIAFGVIDQLNKLRHAAMNPETALYVQP